MSSKYKFRNPEGIYFVSFSVVNWVDAFTRREYKDILIETLKFYQKNKSLEIFAWCIMTNHVHLIIRAENGFLLHDILRDFKKYTSRSIIKAIQNNPSESRKEWLLIHFKTQGGYHFWNNDNHPIELWSNEVINQKINYLHQNPVEEGIVFNAEEYCYSSASDYAGGIGMLDIFVIE